jgi:hypothetical protein
MGCHHSKLDTADDSIHVMLSHCAKTATTPSQAYKPRQQHPLMTGDQRTIVMESECDSENEIDRLLFHAVHHNDTIDPRDLAEYGAEGMPARQ